MQYNDLIVLVPCHSLEDFPSELGEADACSLLNGFTILWHPQLLASTGAYPKWERADDALEVKADRLVIVPTPCDDKVPKTWVERARREGCVVVNKESDRSKMLEAALAPLELTETVDPELVADFLALGTVHLQTELLTRHMRNFSQIDEVHMQREALAAAQAAINNDHEATRKHLNHCYEMLLECRERFYPVDAFLVDLCLVNPDQANDQLREVIGSKIPVSLMATAKDWETILEDDSSWREVVGSACAAKTVDIIGGEYEDLPTPLMALDSIVSQLYKGRRVLEENFGVLPTTWGRKRFGVGTHMPQILDKMGYKSALHFVMDDGIYPDEEQTQLRWEGSDGTPLDAFSRIPLAADSSSAFLRLAMRMAESMDYDHTAAVIFARWPQMRTPWLADLRRASKYGSVLGKFATLSNFFNDVSSPGRLSDFKAGAYFTPNLLHAVAKQEANPISRYLDYWQRRRQFESVAWSDAVVQLLRSQSSIVQDCDLETRIEEAHPEATQETKSLADKALQEKQSTTTKDLSSILVNKDKPGTGLLIVNPHSFARKCYVTWPAGTMPGSEKPILHKQVNEAEAAAVVEIPACGFVVLSAEPKSGLTPVGKLPLAEDLILRNDFFEVKLSEVTGGIGGIQTYQRSPVRISQQVAYRFGLERTFTVGTGAEQETFKSHYSGMELREAKVLCAGPAMGAIETKGELIDQTNGKLLATYRQVTRVFRGRPNIEVELSLDLKKTPTGDPWTNYIGCRFAWKHTTAALTASMQQGAHAVSSQRIEAPHYLEIADDHYRTTLLTPGLTFHRKTGDRMFDTLLITEGETRRDFRFSIAIDSKYPMQSQLDAYSEPLVIPTEFAAPAGGQQGWFFFVGAPNVQLTRILPAITRDGKPGYLLRLLETEGRTKKFPLQCLKTPTKAQQVDFNGKKISDFKIVDAAVMVEVSAYEICDVELSFEDA